LIILEAKGFHSSPMFVSEPCSLRGESPLCPYLFLACSSPGEVLWARGADQAWVFLLLPHWFNPCLLDLPRQFCTVGGSTPAAERERLFAILCLWFPRTFPTNELLGGKVFSSSDFLPVVDGVTADPCFKAGTTSVFFGFSYQSPFPSNFKVFSFSSSVIISLLLKI